MVTVGTVAQYRNVSSTLSSGNAEVGLLGSASFVSVAIGSPCGGLLNAELDRERRYEEWSGRLEDRASVGG